MKIKYKSFLISRFSKLIPLYLLWAIGSLFLMQLSPSWQFEPKLPVLMRILLGQVDYQHYFIPLILVLYALFPFASGLSQTQKKTGTGIILLITFAWYLYIPQLRFSLTHGILQPDQELYLWPFTWLWYAWLGMVAADIELVRILQKYVGKFALFCGSAVLAVIMINHAYFLIQNHVDVLLALRFTNWPVLLYATCAIFLFSVVSLYPSKSRIFEIAGKYSFLVYLGHTFFIRLTISQLKNPVPAFVWFIGTVVFCVLVLASIKILDRKNEFTKFAAERR
jgi:hypothetical protein